MIFNRTSCVFEPTPDAGARKHLHHRDITLVEYSGKAEGKIDGEITVPFGFACLEATHLDCFARDIQNDPAFPEKFRKLHISMIAEEMRMISRKILAFIRDHRQSISFAFCFRAYADTVSKDHSVPKNSRQNNNELS